MGAVCHPIGIVRVRATLAMIGRGRPASCYLSQPSVMSANNLITYTPNKKCNIVFIEQCQKKKTVLTVQINVSM